MSLVVVDASVLVAFYASVGPDRDRVAARLAGGDALFAPAHLDVEVVSALRGLAASRSTLRDAVPRALSHLADLPVRRSAMAPLLSRVWELRDNVTPYDAAYVALAERLDAPVLTGDRRLAAATGPRCRFEILG